MTKQSTGIIFALTAVCIFAVQDGISKHLGSHYAPIFVAMMRYWAFALFVLLFASRAPGGIKAVARTPRPVLQVVRGFLLVTQIVVAITCFALVGLAQTQAIFASTPLFVALLSVPLLGETVGWRRWMAILVGFVGVLLILKPEAGTVDARTLLPIAGAFIFALYAITTRLASRTDQATTSFFYTGIAGAVLITLVGPFYWTQFTPTDAVWMGMLCLTGISGHYLLIRAYDVLEAVVVQSTSYLQLVLSYIVGAIVFGETFGSAMIAGSFIVVGAGMFTIWRESRLGKQPQPIDPPGAL